MSPWYITACARCARPGTVAYRRAGADALPRRLAVIAQGSRSGWQLVGDLAVCWSYPCRMTAFRWDAEDIAASLGNLPPFRTGETAARDAALRADARAFDRPLSTAAPWRRCVARLLRVRGAGR